ncbi:hypothetical protein ACP70R_032665 [Stipagrostis hirtigluma subsp. patula]
MKLQLKIDGYSSTAEEDTIKQRCNVDGYEWEVYADAWHCGGYSYYMLLKLIFLSEAGANDVTASLSCRLVDPSGTLPPSAEDISSSTTFRSPSDSSPPLVLMLTKADLSGYIKDGCLTLECAITVLKDLNAIPLPPTDLDQHFGELLQSQVGADVTFMVGGESFAAHKNVLAARSPVFMAEFFGGMEEMSSRHVEIKETEATVFKAMLHFIYTDKVPELDETHEAADVMAQHLIVAADRYGLERLKVICERRVALGIKVGTAATMLALAERHGCSQLKAKCIEFIAGRSPENLEAVLATEGYKDLEASSPSLVTELLRAANRRNK